MSALHMMRFLASLFATILFFPTLNILLCPFVTRAGLSPYFSPDSTIGSTGMIVVSSVTLPLFIPVVSTVYGFLWDPDPQVRIGALFVGDCAVYEQADACWWFMASVTSRIGVEHRLGRPARDIILSVAISPSSTCSRPFLQCISQLGRASPAGDFAHVLLKTAVVIAFLFGGDQVGSG